jgi:hypothetical protein
MASKRGSRRRKSVTPKRGSSAKKRSYPNLSVISKIQTLFYNRFYLYFISIFSVIYFLGHAINHQYASLITFMIIASVIYKRYTKNMAIVLTTACISTILFSSLYTFLSPSYTKEENIDNVNNTREGMTSQTDEDQDPENKTKENLTPLHPSSLQNNRGGDFDVDLASTLEQSYGMLNNLLDNDGISNLTDETKRLIEEQKKLFQSMNSMAPLIGQAKEMLGMFNTKDFKQMEGLAQSTMGRLNDRREGLNQQQDEEET